MRAVKVVRNKTTILENLPLAEAMLDRMIGLMFKDEGQVKSGLFIDPCKSIHTFFMKFALDVAFVDSKGKVVRVIFGMKPWRLTRTYFTASSVIEVRAGLLPKDLARGDQLEVICIN